MNLKNKNVLLVGLAKTGISVIKKLVEMQANVTVNDIKDKEKLSDILKELSDLENIEYILGYHPEDIKSVDLAIVSPGVPLDLPFIKKLNDENKKIIGEVELAYRLSKKPTFIGITGTNGKTTTTSLVGEIYKEANKETYIVGNIGTPVIDVIDEASKDAILVTELSSFQLESIEEFKPKVAALLNITEDHLNRHHTMENYINAKARVFENQDENDYAILNYDDEMVRTLASKCRAKVIFFSRKHILDEGIYLDDQNNIIINIDNKVINLINKKELSLPGNHNLENAMAAIGMSFVLGIDTNNIKEILKTFKAVEHRLEFVKSINNRIFVNDSKGTNPDSTMKAIDSYTDPIILIAGGKDKQSDFTELIRAFKNVKALVLLGETAQLIQDTAKKEGFDNCYRVNNMEEAVKKSYEISAEGDVILLSPACASWDMYSSYEVRGKDFKDNVLKIG